MWAFLEQHLTNHDPKFKNLGKRIDLLIAKFNGGLHGNITKEELVRAFSHLAILTEELLYLDPDGVRKPYFPFLESMREFLLAVHREHLQDDVPD